MIKETRLETGPAFSPIQLPNGSILKNRIVKAAMQENLANVEKCNQPDGRLLHLYELWARGGAGLIISGHVMIDPFAMSCPADLLLARDGPPQGEAVWRRLSNVTQGTGAQLWLQINHPGRQIKKGSGLPTYAPSPVAIDIGKLSSFYDTPKEMSVAQIEDVIARFAWTAKQAEQLGFQGVEVHAAHGYLISSFLSPLTNRRTDEWGGSLANRSRLLFAVIERIRRATRPSFGVGVKINSSDFQKGGFDEVNLCWVVQELNVRRLDFIELSGGNVESPAMRGSEQRLRQSTRLREEYFLQSAKQILSIAEMPVIITGGITDLATAKTVIAAGSSVLAGIGTAMGLVPDLPNRWTRGENPTPSLSNLWVLSGSLAFAASTAAVQLNLHWLAAGKSTWHGVWPVLALLLSRRGEQQQMQAYKYWLQRLTPPPVWSA